MKISTRVVLLTVAIVGLGCVSENDMLTLGPVDGYDLPGADLERVQIGQLAPDFSLRTSSGQTVTLSEFQGKKDVVLVFYRGKW